MRRPSQLALVLVLATGTTGLAAPAGAAAAESACAQRTGDWCTSVTKQQGRRYLQLSTFSFTGAVKICVRGPERRTCRTATLRTSASGLLRARLRWSRSFPHQGPGIYRVTFTPSITGDQLGPTLSFRVR